LNLIRSAELKLRGRGPELRMSMADHFAISDYELQPGKIRASLRRLLRF